MTAKNENIPFLVLVALISILSVAVFTIGAFDKSGIFAVGFVLIFTSLLGWVASGAERGRAA